MIYDRRYFNYKTMTTSTQNIPYIFIKCRKYFIRRKAKETLHTLEGHRGKKLAQHPLVLG